MTDNNKRINQLLERLESLTKRQETFAKEILELREELKSMTTTCMGDFEQLAEEEQPNATMNESISEPVNVDIAEQTIIEPEPRAIRERHRVIEEVQSSPKQTNKIPHGKSNLEKFIGENLINKIGIAITVIGVAVGAKYSIDHQLISPLTRIILGYLVGAGLLGFGIKLKQKYENYSAVLVSGAIAIMYFITFAAYNFYGLIPQAFAFALMVTFTAFTVVAAIKYDKQVIAHIGLVGAYGVPFLLSDGSGKVGVLFSYMAIINIGILVIAFKRYWKPLSYSSFILTWLIFVSWYLFNYRADSHFGLAFTFLLIFFAIFYATFLAYKLLNNEQFVFGDIMLLLINSFLFYGLGYVTISQHETGKELLGLFTLANAVLHFIVSVVIYKRKLADKNLFFLVSGLVLVFLTITVPVQLDGNWVTLLWVLEAALLFWIGRTKNVQVYEILSYPLMALAFISLARGWSLAYFQYPISNEITRMTPIFNIHFLTSALFVAGFVFINWTNRGKQYLTGDRAGTNMLTLAGFGIPAVLLLVIYCTFMLEISHYWDQLYFESFKMVKVQGLAAPEKYYDYDLKKFKSIWLINYSMLFLSILSFVNMRRIKHSVLGFLTLGLAVFSIVAFHTQGLYQLSELRESYLQQTMAEYYHRGNFNIGIRYISYAFAAMMIFSVYKYLRQEFLQPITPALKNSFEIMVYTSIIWVASSELLTWMDILKSDQSYKLGLSILWGVYALMLIVIGIGRKKQHLRVGAISLFGVTLLKLFFYDISHMSTIAKTIVLVSLGVLLLIISFLYNKYKHIIAEEHEDPA